MTLYKQYMAAKEEMTGKVPRGTVVERLLWHGTSPVSVPGINKNGFDRGYRGKNGKIMIHPRINQFFFKKNDS